jgi:hypothetical protein
MYMYIEALTSMSWAFMRPIFVGEKGKSVAGLCTTVKRQYLRAEDWTVFFCVRYGVGAILLYGRIDLFP